MKILKGIGIGLWCFSMAGSAAHAQNLEDFLSKYTGENGKGYMQPLADAFGANLNSGFFHSARIPRFGLHVNISFVGMTALIGDKQKTFEARTEDPFSPPVTTEAPTVFGSIEEKQVEGTGGTVFVFPGGLDVKWLPLVVPQVTIGSILGTDLTVRYFGMKINDDLGEVKLLGYGLRHSISQYIPLLPVDLAVGIFRQTFEVGGVVEASSMNYGLEGSVAFGILTLYGGLSYESANLNISYEYGSGSTAENISFDLKAANSVRMIVGCSIRLAVLQLYADYNLADQSVFSAGLGFGF